MEEGLARRERILLEVELRLIELELFIFDFK